jgi:A/G-specific adenine glycosylase
MLSSLTEALLAWYAGHARDLPWRRVRDPYGVWVSEIMLQQTRVEAVIPYFDRWMARLPDVRSLAVASQQEVLALWEGLGYYSRARHLHRAAQVLVAEWGGQLPTTAAELERLPGIGRYTAAAIAAIAFDADTIALDGNLRRVLSRLFDLTIDPRSPKGERQLLAHASSLLPGGKAAAFNQALMDLGATVCVRQNPRCPCCPVRRFCAAARRGDPEVYPRLAPKKTAPHAVLRVWCEHRGRLLLYRAAPGARRLAALHELPTPADLGLNAAGTRASPLLARKKRSFTNRQITESIHAVTLACAQRRRLARRPALRWIPLARLSQIALSGPHRRWIEELLVARNR